MPDQYRFNHLPNWGVIEHRCIDCEWPEGARTVRESERKVHFEKHERERRHETEKKKREAAAEARRIKALRDRENAKAYG